MERWEPKAEDCDRSEPSAVDKSISTASRPASVSATEVAWASMPRLVELIASPSLDWMFSEDEPVSLKVIDRASPRSRLMPLKEASSAVRSSCWRRSLNCSIRSARTVLPPIVPPVPVVATAVSVTVRSEVDRFSMRSLPLSFEARTLDVSDELPLIEATTSSTEALAETATVTAVVPTEPPVKTMSPVPDVAVKA